MLMFWVTFFLPIGLIPHILLLCVGFPSLHRSKVSLFRLSSGIILLAHWSLPLLIPLSFFFSSRRCTHYARPLV